MQRIPPPGVYALGTAFARAGSSTAKHFQRGETENMSKKPSTRKAPISQALRKAIRERGLTAYAAAQKAGVSVDAVQRFLKHQRGLTLATVDKLSAALELTLCPEDPPDGWGSPAAGT
jgi:hypothetical protein